MWERILSLFRANKEMSTGKRAVWRLDDVGRRGGNRCCESRRLVWLSRVWAEPRVKRGRCKSAAAACTEREIQTGKQKSRQSSKQKTLGIRETRRRIE